jgi:hypothetical protein
MAAPVTNDELIKHRLRELEDFATGARQTERDVDAIKLTLGSLEGSFIKLAAEMEKNDEHTRASLARLHERLDEITHEERFEQGREQGSKDASSRTWKVIAWTVMAVIAFMAVVVATLNLILN